MHIRIHTQAGQVRPIAVGSAVGVLHAAELCTLLRLRFTLAERKGRGSRLAHIRVGPSVH